MRSATNCIRFVGMVLLSGALGSGCSHHPRPLQKHLNAPAAVAVEPVSAIIDAFRSHNVVALTEGTTHGDEKGHAFLRALVADPRAAAVIDDIVVEWGNALYQDVMDRFVQGEDVPETTLRQVWENTTQPHEVWDPPVYEEFFRAVRAANNRLPKERRFRVLLGDPPVDWSQVHAKSDPVWANSMRQRDSHPAEVVQREVLDKKRKALLVYGGLHLLRGQLSESQGEGGWEPVKPETIVQRLEKNPAAKVFSIWWSADMAQLQPDMVSWPVPTVALIRGTRLGEADFAWYFPFEMSPKKASGSRPSFTGRDPGRASRMEDQFDAVIHAGPGTSIAVSRMARVRCDDARFMAMRISRMRLSDLPEDAVEDLRRYCMGRTGRVPPS